MGKVWEMAIFWFIFAIACGWILRRFYFSKDAALANHLRVTALIVQATIIGSFFFSWLPRVLGGFSGWQIILQGNVGMMALFLLVFISLTFFLTKNHKLLKIGAVLHTVATVLIFSVMIQMMPGTVQLALRDIAPIVAAILMLINMLVVFLLWHQLQKQEKHKI